MPLTVCYRSPFVPAEWIAAHGLLPLRFIPEGHAQPPGADRLGDTEGVCPFLRAFVNEVAATDPTAAIVLTTFCDQERRALSTLRQDPCRRLFLMHVPATCETPESHALYRAEVRRLGRFLVTLGGAPPDAAALAAALTAAEAARRQRPAAAVPTPARAATPVAILGGPLAGKDRVLFDIVTQAGGTVVLDASETGERTEPAPFNRRRLAAEPFDALCDAYFGHIPDAFRRPNAGLYRWLKARLADRQPRGVILVRYVWCDYWHAEVQRLRDWLPVPLLDLDLNAEPPDARTRTRVQAFLECLA